MSFPQSVRQGHTGSVTKKAEVEPKSERVYAPAASSTAPATAAAAFVPAFVQRITLVQVSAQRERFL